MKLKNVIHLKTDIKIKNIYTDEPTIVQNDNVRFVISFLDAGKPLPNDVLNNIQTVTLANVLPNGKVVVTAGEIVGNDHIIFDLGTSETEKPGRVRATVQLYDTDGRVSSLSWNYNVAPDPTGVGYVPSDREKTFIEIMLNDLEGLQQEFGDIKQLGGVLPSNVILFEEWTGGENVGIDGGADPPVDTTPPILTITPASTFVSEKVITMSTNETANIFYTLNGTTPTQNSTRYTSPVTISDTTTLKAFARDTAGNESPIQTIVYTKQDEEVVTGVFDDFNRADNSESLGVANTGQQWVSYRGKWGITNKQARLQENLSNSTVLIESGLSNAKISVKMASYANTNQIVFRAKDEQNYLFYYNKGLHKKVMGVNTKLLDFDQSFVGVSNSEWEISLNGELITIKVDGVEWLSLTESTFVNETKHGLRGNSTDYAIFDNFSVEPI